MARAGQEEHGPLYFEAYKNDPLARLFAGHLKWPPCKFALLYVTVYLAFWVLTIAIYLKRGWELPLHGGYETIGGGIAVVVVVGGFGSAFYLYVSRKAGTIYQQLANSKVIDAADIRVQRLMRTMGLTAIYRRPKTSRPAPGHKVYPYLLRGMEVTRPNQVWAADLTYIPMARGFLYLVAIMDWYSRFVVARRLSNTLDADFCVEALRDALSKEKPEVFNTDQGSQFTSEAFTGLLEQHGVRASMDGKGCYSDNIFVERLWRSVKYEEVYLKASSGGGEAKAGIGDYFRFYNNRGPHQVLGYRTPAEVFNGDLAESRDEAKGRRWSPSRELVDFAETAGPSLNPAPMLSN